jgi:tetratricopeptide (TPR) repeat protein
VVQQNERRTLRNLENITQETFEQLESYILGQLEAAEAQALELRMQSDPVLEAQYREVRQLVAGIEQAALKEDLEKYHMEMVPEVGRVVPFFSRYRLAVAAGLVLLLAALGWVIFQERNPYDRLYADFYLEDPGLITAMSAEGAYAFDRAMVDYKTGNYPAAITQWQSLLSVRPESDTLQYFLGAAHMANGALPLAVPYFQQVAARPQSAFASDSNWYLGLAYLKLGEVAAAREALLKTDRPEKEKILNALPSP